MNPSTRGIVLMVAAMFCFNGSDAIIKTLAPYINVFEIIFIMSIGGVIFASLLCYMNGQHPFTQEMLVWPVIIRALGELLGSIAIFKALELSDLSLVSTVTQASPLLLAAAAALILKEAVGWRRWSAILIGFLGVVFIIDPFSANFDKNVIWSILALIFLTLRDFMARFIPKSIIAPQLSAVGFLVLIPMGYVMMQANGGYIAPTTLQWGKLLIIMLFALGGTITIADAMRYGDVSLVSMFRYTRIIFALTLGFILFDEVASLSMWFGIALVMGSGLFLIWRERALGKQG